ncbi:MAG TPA: glycosyl transferase [Desulfuromonadales bacterium]|nr:glycosyl transferase [Desulfuromonadales bacterium]
MLYVLTIAAFTSLSVALLLLRYLHLHLHLTGDPCNQGPQKFHIGRTPRVGGVPILVGMVAGMLVFVFREKLPWTAALAWLALLPVFAAGLAEDLTKKVKGRWRLLASFVSAGLGCWQLGAVITRLDIPGIDTLLATVPWIAVLFTVVAVGGLCHALNLIDGYNGLAGGVGVIILLSLGYVAFSVGDRLLLGVCLVTIGATAGFLAWNFPRGLIFAGDGGAYLLGFMIAEISVLLVIRNPQVSPWFPCTLVMYPVWETVFTMYRRKVIRGRATGLPDALHLHQMVFNRLVRWTVGAREVKNLRRRNAMTTPYLWGMGLLTVIPATLFWRYTLVLQFCSLSFIVFYVWLYQRLVRFRAPLWLMMHRSSDTNRE